MKGIRMENNLLATESFSSGKKHYYFDFRLAKNKCCYIRVVRSDMHGDTCLQRSELVFFEEDFEFVISAFASLFQSAAYVERFEPEATMPAPDKTVNGIKSWEPELRPRERMLDLGADALEDKELLAILIGSGTPRRSAVDLAAVILDSVAGDLERLHTLSVEELCCFKGMGHAKALTILAAAKLAERRYNARAPRKHLRALARGGSAA